VLQQVAGPADPEREPASPAQSWLVTARNASRRSGPSDFETAHDRQRSACAGVPAHRRCRRDRPRARHAQVAQAAQLAHARSSSADEQVLRARRDNALTPARNAPRSCGTGPGRRPRPARAQSEPRAGGTRRKAGVLDATRSRAGTRRARARSVSAPLTTVSESAEFRPPQARGGRQNQLGLARLAVENRARSIRAAQGRARAGRRRDCRSRVSACAGTRRRASCAIGG
jgi:hypothetical protein